jgi:glycosyltransferase involved in cell wall biosynthesis
MGTSGERPVDANGGGKDLPRIVAFTHEFAPVTGGIAIYTQEVARAAAETGRDIEVWAPENPLLDKNLFSFPVRDLPRDGNQGWPSRLRLALRLFRHSSQWRDSVVWLPEPGPMRLWMYLAALCKPCIRGLVLTLHGSEIELFSSRAHRRWLFRKLLARADRVSVVSRYCRDSLLSRFPEVAPKVVIAHGALRSEVAGTDEPASGALKNGRIVILTVGRIHPRKGQLAVVEALALLEPELRSRFVYRCVGPRRREKYLHVIEQAARELGVAFEYAGEVDVEKLNAEYAHADIFAMTSDRASHSVEGFGLSYLEASSYGLPIVAHRTGGVADSVRDGFNGLKVEPDDRKGLAVAFRALAKDRDLRARLGENGRKWARAFSWSDTATMLFDGIGGKSQAKTGKSHPGNLAAVL